MNERIRELEKQSYITFKDENSFDCLVFSKEKFAELIAKECKLAINQIDADDASMAVGLYRAEVALENLFGVDE